MPDRHLRLSKTMHLFSPEVEGTEPWWKGAVFYEIYPRSFQDSNNDGIGDLRGIERRLPYLNDLGVDAIWIAPFYKSPMADFGYDVSHYTSVDPMFGTISDFDRVLEKAHRLNMRVVIDFVPNHTSDDHPWFIESRSSRSNPKRDWYIWRDGKRQSQANSYAPPNNWPSFFGGSAWTLDEHTSQYYLHLFLDRQPDLNWRNPDVVEAMQNAMGFWLDKGVDGFRLDAIGFLVKHPDLPDLPIVPDVTNADLAEYHIYTNNLPELHEILKGFRRYARKFGDHHVFIGETGSLKPSELSQFYGTGNDEIQLPQIFLPVHTGWNAKSMRDCFIAFYEALPTGSSPHFNIDNHDARRLTDRYGVENHRSVGMLLLTLLAAPCLYYGDEIGMREGVIPSEKRQDPFDGQMAEHSLGRDPSRTPMQWTTEANAGFTSDGVEPWLRVNPDYQELCVEVQEQDPASTLSFYKRLLHVRRHSTALRLGSIQFLDGGADDVLSYVREHGNERFLVAINFAGDSHRLDISALAASAESVLSSRMEEIDLTSIAEITLHPHESILLKIT